ncbi:MAG: hypothetical protein EBT03_09140 [Betaproteobacteria bacterium]|nr:hypothetical protein [Betaproteobacteria bacterium]
MVAPAARALAVVPRCVRATGVALVLGGQLARDRQEDDGRAARANPVDRPLVDPERKGAVARLPREQVVAVGVADDDHGRQLALLRDRTGEDAVAAFASSALAVESSHRSPSFRDVLDEALDVADQPCRRRDQRIGCNRVPVVRQHVSHDEPFILSGDEKPPVDRFQLAVRDNAFASGADTLFQCGVHSAPSFRALVFLSALFIMRNKQAVRKD